MPRCAEPDCISNAHLSVFLFYDPFNHFLEQGFRCQRHSDQTLHTYTKPYEDLEIQIQGKKKTREIERKNNNIYNVKPEYNATDKIKELYALKNKISNYQCRSLICGNPIPKHQMRFVCTVLHANGNFRHYLYFCSLKCMNTLKAQTGVKVPILAGQTSL